MYPRLAAFLLIVVMLTTVAMRSTPPASAHMAVDDSWSQVHAEAQTPYTAPQQGGRTLQDLVSRANTWPLASLVPVLPAKLIASRLVACAIGGVRRSLCAPRRDLASKRDRTQSDANDPA